MYRHLIQPTQNPRKTRESISDAAYLEARTTNREAAMPSVFPLQTSYGFD
jgi:hypothetical protein